MERQNTSKLFLLPALALGLIVAWTSYAGTETSIEHMSSSIGAGSWQKGSGCCHSNATWTCESKPNMNCTVEGTGARYQQDQNDKQYWTYYGFCQDGDSTNCENGDASACQDDKPDDPSP